MDLPQTNNNDTQTEPIKCDQSTQEAKLLPRRAQPSCAGEMTSTSMNRYKQQKRMNQKLCGKSKLSV